MTEPFLSISEVSARIGVPAHTLRYWEKQFPVAVKPATGSGGRRYYRAEVVQALGKIKELLYDRGMTISGVKKIISEGKLEIDNLSNDLDDKIDTLDLGVVSNKKTTNSGINSLSADEIDNVISFLNQAKQSLT